MLSIFLASQTFVDLGQTVTIAASWHVPEGRLRLVNEQDELIARCKSGDQTAFRQLFHRHRDDVMRLVYRLMGQRADVEDVVQEVFVQVFRSLRDFRGDSKFSTWVHRVTVNVVLMTRRAARSRPVFAGEPPNPNLTSAHQTLPDEETARNQRMVAFQRCIERLTEKKRLVFVLHELEGLSTVEIAEIVSIPVLTVRTRLFYARKELCQLMKEEPSLEAYASHLERGANSKKPLNPENVKEESA
jgi:RNA polymerase sigma-70 factor, ECF subfamily